MWAEHTVVECYSGWCIKITHNDAPQSVGLLWMSDQLVQRSPTDCGAALCVI